MPLADACDAFASLIRRHFRRHAFRSPLSCHAAAAHIFAFFRRHAAAAAFTRQLFALFRRRDYTFSPICRSAIARPLLFAIIFAPPPPHDAYAILLRQVTRRADADAAIADATPGYAATLPRRAMAADAALMFRLIVCLPCHSPRHAALFAAPCRHHARHFRRRHLIAAPPFRHV
jgi:hypothetical protein